MDVAGNSAHEYPPEAGRRVTRPIPVCAPHLFIALKALAMANRDKHKDAYDIYYVLKNDERGPEAVGNKLAAFANQEPVADAIGVLARDFQSVDGRGPVDVCRFLDRQGDDNLAADVLAFARAFLNAFARVSSSAKVISINAAEIDRP